MIADEIKKAGQATIDQCVADLVTYKLTDTWTSPPTVTGDTLGALACNTRGSYRFDGDFGEYYITFTQDVCRYNGTPVKTFNHEDHGHGDYDTYRVLDFADNVLYYGEYWPSGTFTIRQIEWQNNKQSFQILDSEMPAYIDEYNETPSYSEAGLLNTTRVPTKKSCVGIYNRYLTTLGYREVKKLATVNAADGFKMVMINIVQSNNYDWTSAYFPTAGGNLNVKIKTVDTSTVLIDRDSGFNYYNPGNMMFVLQPFQIAEVSVSVNVGSGETTKVLCTIQETAI